MVKTALRAKRFPKTCNNLSAQTTSARNSSLRSVPVVSFEEVRKQIPRELERTNAALEDQKDNKGGRRGKSEQQESWGEEEERKKMEGKEATDVLPFAAFLLKGVLFLFCIFLFLRGQTR